VAVFGPRSAASWQGQAPGYGHPFGFPRLPAAGGVRRSACGQRHQSEAWPRWVTGLTLVKCGRSKSVVIVDVPAVGEPPLDVQAGR
jgi:hypothetical protein